MKLIIANTALKGTLTPRGAAMAIAAGARRWQAEVRTELCPLADGGNGFREVIASSAQGREVSTRVIGPLFRPIKARFSIINDGRTAVIEAAEANGLHLLQPEQYDPFICTTYGVGDLLNVVASHHVDEVLIGVGGSCTNDGGCGMASSLGVQFEPARLAPYAGNSLRDLTKVDVQLLYEQIKPLRIRVACDVNNPLYGPNGAAYVYGPQKFNPANPAKADDLKQLDDGLRNLARLLDAEKQAELPGMGAAGGLSFGLAHFLGAELCSGIELVMEAVGFEKRVKGADLIITGEGSIDDQSLNGKVAGAVARIARKHKIPVIGLAGRKGKDWESCVGPEGLNAVYSIVEDLGIGADAAAGNASENLTVLAETALHQFYRN